jgi:hypothetical protein
MIFILFNLVAVSPFSYKNEEEEEEDVQIYK